MKFTETEIEGCYLITYDSFVDNRGYFSVPFNENEFKDNVKEYKPFIQNNLSYSHLGVVRGLHFQTGEYEQAKLVTCWDGFVLDVVVDIRKDSKTYGKVLTFELGKHYNRLVYVPRGCAHGFSVLSSNATFYYQVDNHYNKESEGGIIYNDSTLNIDWKLDNISSIVSEKDLELPTFLSL
jgi:dTDP-4-dehydrorhamnose 3,5-epimerase